MTARYVIFSLLIFFGSISYVSAATNLVQNGDFETVSSTNTAIPQNWNKNSWGSLTPTFTYPVTGKDGGKAARVNVSNRYSGDAKWFFPHIPTSAGEKYQYTDNYIANVTTDVTVEYKMSNGSYSYIWLNTAPIATTWGTFTKEFTVPSGAVSFTVFHTLGKNGSLTIDNVSVVSATATTTPPPPQNPPPTCSLSASPTTITNGAQTTLTWSTTHASTTSINNNIGTVTPSGNGSVTTSPAQTTTYTLTATGPGGSITCNTTVTVTQTPPPPPTNQNLVTNGNFETVGSAYNIPQNWNKNSWGSLRATFSYPIAGKNGGKATRVAVSRYVSGDAKWVFTHIPITNGALYKYTADYYATVKTNLSVEFKMSDGSFEYMWLGDLAAASSWTTFTTQITPPPDAVSFTVFQALQRNGTLTIDNVSVVALPANPFAEPMVTFVFDDGLASQFANARPILTAEGIKGVFGIVTQYVGSSPYATWANLTTLKNEGHEIASHTRTHADLTTLTSTQLQSEVAGSQSDLVAQGFTPKTFVYPYGATNPTVKQAVKNAGFVGARSSSYGLNTPTGDKYALHDFRLDTSSTLAGVKAMIDQAVADKRWLVFELHDILASGGDEYTITPSFLQAVIDYVQEKGVKVVTLEEGVALMTQP